MKTHQFRIETEHPLAHGPDTKKPMGARLGNARCPRWNQLVFELLAPNYSRPVNVIDLGCAGGGWVKDCWDWGHVAVGIDGCNWGRVHGNCEWATIPQYLFTADIAKPFTVHDGGGIFLADLITAWDVLEHVPERGLEVAIVNAHFHLKDGGLFVCTVSTLPDERNGARYHATVKPEEWWQSTFANLGFYRLPDLERYFCGHYVRGPKHPISGGTPFVLSPSPTLAPKPPRKSLAHSLMDRWHGSFVHRCVKHALIGPTEENR